MKKFNILLLLLITMAILAMLTAVQAQDPQYETVTTMAEDVNCRECHTANPHEIHAGKPVNCQNCHGETLSISIPQCTQCHTGPIHEVHIGKVRTEECSYCHSDVDTYHSEMISNTLCSHCHKDLITVHGGPAVSCDRCHGTAPDIVKPVQAEEATVICQNCHISEDVSDLHGGIENRSACYRCHRPGSAEVESPSEIPHFLHIPKVDCNRCHLNQDTGKIYIPKCSQCHSVHEIHDYNTIGLKTAKTGLKCSVCHPIAAEEPQKPVKTPTSAATEATETATEGGVSGIPGFGVFMAFISLAVIYLTRKIRD